MKINNLFKFHKNKIKKGLFLLIICEKKKNSKCLSISSNFQTLIKTYSYINIYKILNLLTTIRSPSSHEKQAKIKRING